MAAGKRPNGEYRMNIHRLLIAIMLAAAAGCGTLGSHNLRSINREFAPPYSVSLAVNGKAVVHWLITTEDPLSTRITEWLNTHRHGWKKCRISVPANVFVSGEQFQININDGYMAILYSDAAYKDHNRLYRQRDSEVDDFLEVIREFTKLKDPSEPIDVGNYLENHHYFYGHFRKGPYIASTTEPLRWTLPASKHTVSNLPELVDIDAYEIGRNEIKQHIKEEDKQVWHNILMLCDGKVKVPLARSRETKRGDTLGFQEKTLKLRWLDKGKLLWITWRSIAVTSRRLYYDGHVVLQIKDGGIYELLRDNFAAGRGGGGAHFDYWNLEIKYCPEGGIELSKARHFGDGMYDEPLPLTRAFKTEDGPIRWFREIRTISKWRYKISDDELTFLNGQKLLDCGSDKYPIVDVAKVLRVDMSRLLKLNESLGKNSSCTGKIILDDKLWPYKVRTYDGLYWSK